MENYYQAILQKLAENTPVALETIISGEEGERKTGLSRRLTDVVPVADARGRRFARVMTEEAEGKLTVREPDRSWRRAYCSAGLPVWGSVWLYSLCGG